MAWSSAPSVVCVCVVLVLCAIAVAFCTLWTRAATAFELSLRPDCAHVPPLTSPRSGDGVAHALAVAATVAGCPMAAVGGAETLRWVGDGHAALLARFADGSVVVALRGTRTTEDAIVNLDVTLIGNPYGAGRVHRGFLEQYQAIRPELQQTLGDVIRSGDVLFLTGHSLGAALATLAYDDLRGARAVEACVTFGSPKVGDSTYARHLERVGAGTLRVWSNALDPMCTMPARDYCTPMTLVERVAEDRGSWNANHAMRLYLEQTRRRSERWGRERDAWLEPSHS